MVTGFIRFIAMNIDVNLARYLRALTDPLVFNFTQSLGRADVNRHDFSVVTERRWRLEMVDPQA